MTRARRREAADALVACGAFAVAAAAYEGLLAHAADEAERVALSEGAFAAHRAAGEADRALDVLVRMRLSGRKNEAARMLVAAASQAGFHREAAAQADLLRAADAHDRASLRAALASHLEVGQWAKAMDDLADLARLEPESTHLYLPQKGRALLGLRKLTEAVQCAEQAAAKTGPTGLAGRRLKLAIAIARADAEAIASAVREVLADAPDDTASRVAAARALATVGQLDKAARLLASGPIVVADDDDAVAATAILVAGQNAAHAATVLDALPNRGAKARRCRALLALLLNQPPGDDIFAVFLDRVANRDFDAAREAAKALPEPPAVCNQWVAAVGPIEARPDSASTTALELARARIFIEANLLTDRADTVLRGLAQAAGSAAGIFDLLRAWWRLEAGDAKAAADVVVPLMETHANDLLVMLTAAVAGTRLAGEGAALKLLDGTAATPPAGLASSMWHALAKEAYLATALKCYARIEQPTERDRALRFLVASERRESTEAARVLKTLPPTFQGSARFALASLWSRAQNEKTRPAAATELRRLAASPEARDGLDADLLYEAMLLAGLDAEAAVLLRGEIAKSPFSAPMLERFAAVLRRTGIEKSTLDLLEDRLRTVDPTLGVRAETPRPIAID